MSDLAPELMADVMLWGTRVGVVIWDPDAALGFFEYDRTFLSAPVELAPIVMPKAAGSRVFSFPELNRETFKGLPGLLADALPDRFGNRLIDRWLAEQERSPASFSPVERLCYVGDRAMGALEFKPTLRQPVTVDKALDIAHLVDLASDILTAREDFKTNLQDAKSGIEDILLVGTSAGGARAKAVIAWNPSSHEVRSGQVSTPSGFGHWLLKFDGVANNRDKELADPQGFGRIEYAYSKMAAAAGITMMECRLLEEHQRAHFMTRRFDRLEDGDKLHMQSLCALAHYDFNAPGAYSYEQAFQVLRLLETAHQAGELEQLFRRMVFNIVARNQDDHVKNIAFLMNRKGEWSLAPAYDMIYSFNPRGKWTSRHQMSCNGKREDFTLLDLIEAGKKANLPPARARRIVGDIVDVCSNWKNFARQAQVSDTWIQHIGSHLRLHFD
ncbi:type II toxin-antitoxin system HipA family toxin [Exilibacterium tricleocarpae]|uniref:Type II toxin-antitoxin system HipA family toxin n=1 Tax=Exilibacterium tricleocarpae TaxID=2591008 RepID=A0A545U9E3_9GAMM|nr:type II toxin-antitoxin system HipA family toxin [Exilibacterium tricleocarpae]TQV86092.1 type II toxin-antitoxin system HipA family toxin [Exilibacterium tricleocarpae]